ncbi:MAG TPA: mycothiol synthase [Actinotalea sp.]
MISVDRVDRPDPALADRVRELARAAEEHDGVEALGEQTLLDLVDPLAQVTHLIATQDADLVGYAQVAHPDDASTVSAELVVGPGPRRRGVGAALLRAVQDVARAAGARPAVWAHGRLPGAEALARSAGLVVVRELWRMSVEPTSTPAVAIPDGLVVRPFVVGSDEAAVLAVNARAFAGHPEQGRMTLHDLQAREAEPWFSAADLLLAERGGRLVAFVWMKVEPGSDEGELYVLGVDPDAQGQGLGRLLTDLTLEHLTGRGLRRVVLYTSPDNEAAVRTYERSGFAVSRVDVQYG